MKTALIILCALLSVKVSAQTEIDDSIKATQLSEVVVEAKMQRTSATVSTYIPTSKQKNAAQTGGELLNSMAIPQLKISDGINIETATGSPVDVFIDFQPASTQDLAGMRMADVKKVEYYDYPTDPRFQGKAHVVNIVMQKYEYGGYLKGFANENFITNSAQLNLFAKFQYRKFTYDIAGGIFYNNSSHNGYSKEEVFRLPLSDGSINVFERHSSTLDSKLRQQNYWTTFKALYQTEKISLSNILAVDFNDRPKNMQNGEVSYSSNTFPTSEFYSNSSSEIKSLTYSGYWNFVLSSNNTITFNPNYSYSHTNQSTYYSERDKVYPNGAKDNSHQAKGDITFTHNFGKGGTLKGIVGGLFRLNQTAYSGTTNIKDEAKTYRIGPGIVYSISSGNLYGQIGVGIHWDKSKYEDIDETSTAPWVDLSLQYSFNSMNSISTDFHYNKSIPSSSFRSASVVTANPLMSYTGNPSLFPFNSYEASIRYTFLPSNKFNLSVFGSTWIVKDRYVYDYEASETGILRTIKQPMGSYAQGQYGIYGSTRQFNGKLLIGGSLSQNIANNGTPYNWTKSYISYAFQVYYYHGNFNFGGTYISSQGYPDGCMVGTWMRMKDQYYLQAGWANTSWNVRITLRNFARWNWNSSTATVKSENYDYVLNSMDSNRHAMVQLSATYTFGFGKKIKQGNEAIQQAGISSGILK